MGTEPLLGGCFTVFVNDYIDIFIVEMGMDPNAWLGLWCQDLYYTNTLSQKMCM